MELQMEFQTSDVNICNGNKKYPIGTSTFYKDFLCWSSFIFTLLLLTVYVQSIICNSLLTMFTTAWQNLNKIGWSQLHKIWIFFDKKPAYFVNHFWYFVSAGLIEVLCVKQVMMLLVFIIELPSFSISKLSVVWHFKPSSKSNRAIKPNP